MSKSVIGLGGSANDGTGDSLRATGSKINANFTEIYNAVGDGTNIAFDVSGATSGQSLVYNNSTGKFEPVSLNSLGLLPIITVHCSWVTGVCPNQKALLILT